MTLALWYVSSNLDAQEDFISFVYCENGLAGKNLGSVLIEKIDSLGLEIENCRGKAYDGSRKVAGPKNNLAAEITCLSSKALYMNCFNHWLNLSVANALQMCKVSWIGLEK